VATTYNNIGVTRFNRSEYDQALEFFHQCLNIELETFGKHRPSLVSSYSNIGDAWHNKGEYNNALEFYQQCLEFQLKALGKQHPDVSTSFWNIGNCQKKIADVFRRYSIL